MEDKQGLTLEEVVKRGFSKKRGTLGDRVNDTLVSISEKIKHAIGTATLATVLTTSSLLLLCGYDATLSNKMGVEPTTNTITRPETRDRPSRWVMSQPRLH